MVDFKKSGTSLQYQNFESADLGSTNDSERSPVLGYLTRMVR